MYIKWMAHIKIQLWLLKRIEIFPKNNSVIKYLHLGGNLKKYFTAEDLQQFNLLSFVYMSTKQINQPIIFFWAPIRGLASSDLLWGNTRNRILGLWLIWNKEEKEKEKEEENEQEEKKNNYSRQHRIYLHNVM